MLVKHSLRHHLTPLESLLVRRWRPTWICLHRRASPRITRLFATSIGNTHLKPYYVTTPIFYVNAAPHVGHLYSMVLADVLKRWQLLKGVKAILSTGTDEHGLKVQQAAQKAGIDPKTFSDKGAAIFRDLTGAVNISNDHFVRTTDSAHKDAVQYAWHILQEKEYIYASKHQGWYSISDEAFYPESAVKVSLDPATGRKLVISVETGKEVQWTSEQNYHFRLSAFKDRLLAWYRENPDWIVPASRMQQVVAAVEDGLDDLSVSRPLDRLSWGIRVPTDDTQTVYVWLDALLNYATQVGYPWTLGRESEGGWPADIHVIGKDIVRFHCVYWPAFLMALGLPLPRRILTHAHWLLGNQKMSKSTGNGVNPFFAINRFGIDALRYFLVHSGGIEKDAEYDNRLVAMRYNKDLRNGLGNLASRVLFGRGWNVARAIARYRTPGVLEKVCIDFSTNDNDNDNDSKISSVASLQPYRLGLETLAGRVQAHMDSMMPSDAVQEIANQIYEANVFFQLQAPWDISRSHHYRVKEKKEWSPEEKENMDNRLSCPIYLAAETLRIVGILLQPVIPEKAASLLDLLGVADENRRFEDARVGADLEYGVPRSRLKDGKHILFPVLASDA